MLSSLGGGGVSRRCEDAHPGEAGGRMHPWTSEDLQAHNSTRAQTRWGSGVCWRAQGDLQQEQAEPEEGKEANHQELVLHTLRGERTAEPLDDQNDKYPLARISKRTLSESHNFANSTWNLKTRQVQFWISKLKRVEPLFNLPTNLLICLPSVTSTAMQVLFQDYPTVKLNLIRIQTPIRDINCYLNLFKYLHWYLKQWSK